MPDYAKYPEVTGAAYVSAIEDYVARFGSLQVTVVGLASNSPLEKRLFYEIQEALRKGERFDEEALEAEIMEGVPSTAHI